MISGLSHRNAGYPQQPGRCIPLLCLSATQLRAQDLLPDLPGERGGERLDIRGGLADLAVVDVRLVVRRHLPDDVEQVAAVVQVFRDALRWPARDEGVLLQLVDVDDMRKGPQG